MTTVTQPSPDTRYGRTGTVTGPRITLAVAAAYPRPDKDQTQAHAYRRLLAVLAASADEHGTIPRGLTYDTATALAGLRPVRDTRKAWAELLKDRVVDDGGGGLTMRGGPDPELPVVLCSDDGHVTVTGTDPARLDPDDLEDLDGWMRRTATALRERGLPTWLAEATDTRLAAAAAAAAAAIDPDGLPGRAAQADQAAQALLNEIEKAERSLRAAERRRDGLLETAARLRADIDALTEAANDTDAARTQVDEAVRLARAVLDAAALLEAPR